MPDSEINDYSQYNDKVCREILLKMKEQLLSYETYPHASKFKTVNITVTSGGEKKKSRAPRKAIEMLKHIHSALKVGDKRKNNYLKTVRKLAKMAQKEGAKRADKRTLRNFYRDMEPTRLYESTYDNYNILVDKLNKSDDPKQGENILANGLINLSFEDGEKLLKFCSDLNAYKTDAEKVSIDKALNLAFPKIIQADQKFSDKGTSLGTKAVRFLEKHRDAITKDPANLQDALSRAVHLKHMPMTEKLLQCCQDNNVSVDFEDLNGQALLYDAASSSAFGGDPSMYNLLVKYGAKEDVSLKKDGLTPKEALQQNPMHQWWLDSKAVKTQTGAPEQPSRPQGTQNVSPTTPEYGGLPETTEPPQTSPKVGQTGSSEEYSQLPPEINTQQPAPKTDSKQTYKSPEYDDFGELGAQKNKKLERNSLKRAKSATRMKKTSKHISENPVKKFFRGLKRALSSPSVKKHTTAKKQTGSPKMR